MRYIRYISIAIFSIALITVALANRQMVTVKVLPEELATQFAMNPSVTMPLFLVILAGILVGLLVGFVWEWMREHQVRSEASRRAKEVRRLERENRRLRTEKPDNQGDEVLAILEEAR